MKITQTQKTIIGIIILAILGFFAYTFFFKSSAAPTSDAGMATSTADDIAGQDIVILIQKLSTISIDSSLFNSPLFTNLRDSATILTPEAQGRPNPFAAIGSNSGSIVSNATASSTKTLNSKVQ